jgi:hypothetical protein
MVHDGGIILVFLHCMETLGTLIVDMLDRDSQLTLTSGVDARCSIHNEWLTSVVTDELVEVPIKALLFQAIDSKIVPSVKFCCMLGPQQVIVFTQDALILEPILLTYGAG